MGCFWASIALLATTITVDASKVVGPLDNRLWANIGYDPLYVGTVNDYALKVLRLMRESRAFRYFRCHNLFSDGLPRGRRLRLPGRFPSPYFGCRVYSEDEEGNPCYDFTFADQVYDLMLSAGLRPIVETDFMPDALAEGEIIRNYGGGAVNTPKDYRKWRDLIYNTVKHFIERYGRGEVERWYWEVWNEPDLRTYFIDGDGWWWRRKGWDAEKAVERFCKMFDYFVEGAKSADRNVKVGGPGLAGNPAFMLAFLRHCAEGRNTATGGRGTPLDFISWHGYGRTDSLLRKNRLFKAMVLKFPQFRGSELHQNEWGQPLRIMGRPNRSPSVFHEFEACFLAKYVHAMLSDESASVDLFLRWGQLAMVPRRLGGWRALTVFLGDEPIPTPVFNAYILLSRLGPERLEVKGADFRSEVGAIAARSREGVQVLVYRFNEREEEGAGAPERVELVVKGLTKRGLTLKCYLIDKWHANFYRVWERMGRPKSPSPEAIKRLSEAAKLRPMDGPRIVEAENGIVKLTFELPMNSLTLVVLGEEFRRDLDLPPVVRRLLDGERAYFKALEMAERGDLQGARRALENVAEKFSDCFFGYRALFALLDVLEEMGDEEGADRVREKLLSLRLGDPERIRLLKERAEFLRSQGKATEASRLEAEARKIEAKLRRPVIWSR